MWHTAAAFLLHSLLVLLLKCLQSKLPKTPEGAEALALANDVVNGDVHGAVGELEALVEDPSTASAFFAIVKELRDNTALKGLTGLARLKAALSNVVADLPAATAAAPTAPTAAGDSATNPAPAAAPVTSNPGEPAKPPA